MADGNIRPLNFRCSKNKNTNIEEDLQAARQNNVETSEHYRHPWYDGRTRNKERKTKKNKKKKNNNNKRTMCIMHYHRCAMMGSMTDEKEKNDKEKRKRQ